MRNLHAKGGISRSTTAYSSTYREENTDIGGVHCPGNTLSVSQEGNINSNVRERSTQGWLVLFVLLNNLVSTYASRENPTSAKQATS